jgi:hypothetical protein
MPSASSQASARAPAPPPSAVTAGRARTSSNVAQSPLENLSLQDTLRVMDVAREMRDRRETAEEMFRRDDLRGNLREKLLRTARMSGDNVTEAEIDAAIGKYMETLYVFQEPEAGFSRFMAHCWVWRGRIAAGAATLAPVALAFWFLFA